MQIKNAKQIVALQDLEGHKSVPQTARTLYTTSDVRCVIPVLKFSWAPQ